MRDVDFTPLFRSAIGFDRMMDLLQHSLDPEPGDGNYPPYNIEKAGEDTWRLTMAVAGFSPDEIEITQEQNLLLLAGRRGEEDGRHYLHRGIASRAFQRRFELADYVRVSEARLENGLLTIDLVREVPEEKKPRRVAIRTGSPPEAAKTRQIGRTVP